MWPFKTKYVIKQTQEQRDFEDDVLVRATKDLIRTKLNLEIQQYRDIHKQKLSKSLGYKKALEDAVQNKKKHSHIKTSYEYIMREYCEIGRQIEALEDVYNKLFN